MRRGVGGLGVIVAMLASGAGCGGNGGGSGGGGSLSTSQLGAEYATVFCRKVFACCDAAEIAGSNPTFPDEAACRTAVGARITAELAGNQLGIDAGLIIYRGDSARRCLDALAALPCAKWGADEELRQLPDCLQITSGTIVPGQDCARDEECKDGFCDGALCVAYARAGESCTAGACLPPLTCASNASGVPTVCATPLPDGSPCSYDSDCASFCEANVCGPPTFCNGV